MDPAVPQRPIRSSQGSAKLHSLREEDVARKANGALLGPDVLPATAWRGRTISQYHNEQVIFAQGDPADSVFYVIAGKVKIAVTSKQGKEAVIALLGEGSFFGEGCLIGQALRLATVTAMTDSTVMRLEKAEMIRVIHADPAFSEVFTVYLLSRNSRVEADLVDQLFNSSEKRLARVLLLLANFDQEGGPRPVTLKINQETLAEMVGTTRSRVSFFMNRFRKLGFIEYDGKPTVQHGRMTVHNSLSRVILRD
jgi:CRP-like cAMP-binding protein